MSRWLFALVLVSGCAFSLSGPDPARPRNEFPKCDTGKGAVVLDSLMATAAGVTTLALLAADEPALALLPAAIGALYVGGAIHGTHAVDECHKAVDEYVQASSAREMLARTPPPDDSGDGDTNAEVMRRPRPRKQLPPTTAVVPPPEEAVVTEPAPAPMPVGAPAPTPTAAPVPTASAPRPAAVRKPEPPQDPWSDFWREVQ